MKTFIETFETETANELKQAINDFAYDNDLLIKSMSVHIKRDTSFVEKIGINPPYFAFVIFETPNDDEEE